MNPVRIFVVGAQDIFRTGVITIANNENTYKVIGDAPRLGQALPRIMGGSPDLILFDLQDCDLTRDLSQLVRDNRSQTPRCIVITSASTNYELTQCVRAGVSGIICRNVAHGEMIAAIGHVMRGRVHYCSHTSEKLKHDSKQNSLTKRELEVLHSLALGLSNKEIAKNLGLGVGTVKTHLININAKLHVTTRTEAVVRGFQKRLISL